MAQWKLDLAHSYASFSVRHMMVTTVRGKFDNVEGVIDFDPANPAAASVEVKILASSIATGMEPRDNHLRSADFLDAANHPYLTFKSTKIRIIDPNNAKVTGDLTIRGKTLPVTLNVEYLGTVNSPFGDVRAGFAASTKINREDWGLTWNQALEAGGVLVGKEVAISIDVEGIQVTEAEKVEQSATA
jgi:polyisoprenoid-binding protein YceI